VIIKRANLTETSLYTLSKLAGIEDGPAFVQEFINHERKIRTL